MLVDEGYRHTLRIWNNYFLIIDGSSGYANVTLHYFACLVYCWSTVVYFPLYCVQPSRMLRPGPPSSRGSIPGSCKGRHRFWDPPRLLSSALSGDLTPELMRPGREADHWPSSRASRPAQRLIHLSKWRIQGYCPAGIRTVRCIWQFISI